MEKIMNSVRQWLARTRGQSADTAPAQTGADPAAASASYKPSRIQTTPNPHACQFFVDKTIVGGGGSVAFNSPEEAERDPFAKELFTVFGVESVFIKEQFVTVTKSPVVSWNSIMEPIESAIESHLRFYPDPAGAPAEIPASASGMREFTPDEFMDFPDAEKEKVIRAILDYAIRPLLANDGGDLRLLGIRGNTIHIHYEGACGTCPSSTRGTLTYIESLIKENLHPELIVEAR